MTLMIDYYSNYWEIIISTQREDTMKKNIQQSRELQISFTMTII